MQPLIPWLLKSNEPWTRYRTRVDLLGQIESSAEVQADRAQLLAHPQVQSMIADAAAWGAAPIKRHNDAGHAIYKLSTLADFGLRLDDPGMPTVIELVLAHQSQQGAFQSLVNISPTFGGSGQDQWAWAACDAPTLLYALLSFDLGDDPRVRQAIDCLLALVTDHGWECAASPELGKFRGPGRKTDPCPIANVYALKALALVPHLLDSPAAHQGAEMLLSHWQASRQHKYYLFGVGSDYRKLKYPFVWYDLLHVADVLSRFPFTRSDPRFIEMLAAITSQADAQGQYTAASMYQSWKGWSFADKKNPSPWLTFLVLRIQSRCSDQVA